MISTKEMTKFSKLIRGIYLILEQKTLILEEDPVYPLLKNNTQYSVFVRRPKYYKKLNIWRSKDSVLLDIVLPNVFNSFPYQQYRSLKYNYVENSFQAMLTNKNQDLNLLHYLCRLDQQQYDPIFKEYYESRKYKIWNWIDFSPTKNKRIFHLFLNNIKKNYPDYLNQMEDFILREL